MELMNTIKYILAFAVALAISYIATPLAKKFAFVVGAVDVPRDNRRMHKTPVPRLGGLAIFLGFLISSLIFGTVDRTMASILIGALIIVTLGVLDDILRLNAGIKFVVQVIAACFPVLYGGLRIEFFTNFNFASSEPFVYMGFLSIPVTLLWIVGLTNAVNFIDGLDGLAAGVSTIAAMSFFAVSLITQNYYAAVISLALVGACLGFLPFNLNPAKIFMGDTGSEFLGFILATISIQGMFKFYAVISFAVPFLILGLPLFDLVSSVLRRVLSGKNPTEADRGHIHHKLIDMGFNQKQAVAILYIITTILGTIGVILSRFGAAKAALVLLALLLIGTIVFRIFLHTDKHAEPPAVDKKSETKDE